MVVNNELGSMWKEVVVAKLQHLHGGTEGNHEKRQSGWCSHQDMKQAPPAYKSEVLFHK
jgi:hypothetical protein